MIVTEIFWEFASKACRIWTHQSDFYPH